VSGKITRQELDPEFYQELINAGAGTGGGTSISDGLTIKAKGGDEISNIMAVLNEAASYNPPLKVKLPAGQWHISNTIIVPPKVEFDIDHNAIIIPTQDQHIFRLMPECNLHGGRVDLRYLSFTFTKAVLYANAADMFQLYEQQHTVRDMNVMGKHSNTTWTGTGILFEAEDVNVYINNIRVENCTFTNLENIIHLRVDPFITTGMSWINACTFDITAMNFKRGIWTEGLSGIPRDVGGNFFYGQWQAEAGTENIVRCESAYNTFDMMVWDVQKMDDANPAVHFTSTSRFNKFSSFMQYELTESWKDEGYLNEIQAPGNYMPDKKTVVQRLPTPFNGQFTGIQDDYLIYGDLRGYTIAQTGGPAPLAGALVDVFGKDTEAGVTWDMTTATYESPVVLEITAPSDDPVWYMQFLGVLFPWNQFPSDVRLEAYDGLSSQWIWLHEIKANKGAYTVVSPPWAGVDKATKFRITLWGYVQTDKKVTLSRVFATSSKDGGRAFLSQSGGDASGSIRFTTPGTGITVKSPNGLTEKTLSLQDDGFLSIPGAKPNMPPALPGELTMVGDQDDILHLADKRYIVTSTGAVKTAGNIADMFSLKREVYCRWTNPTTAAPIVIELDFGANPIKYMESIGINFGWGETPKNIKVERVLTSGGAYAQLKNVTNNTDAAFHIASRATNVYKIRLTISVPNNANTLIRINRIYGTAAESMPRTFVNTETDNDIRGDLTFSDLLKGPVLTSPDGSKWRVSISNAGVITGTKI
jgi:hypothetical protein